MRSAAWAVGEGVGANCRSTHRPAWWGNVDGPRCIDSCARLYRLLLERGAVSSAYRATAFREITTVIGRQLGLPVEPREREHFGWFAAYG
ncbi:MAG: hypothetical protein ABIT36_02650 [Steroidobacteraceae bacterium]